MQSRRGWCNSSTGFQFHGARTALSASSSNVGDSLQVRDPRTRRSALHFFATRTPVPARTFTGLTAAVQLRLRVAVFADGHQGLQTLTVKSRPLTGENSVRFRGNPPIQMWSVECGMRNQRRRATAVFIPHSAFRIPHLRSIRGEIYYHTPLRTESLQVGILPDAPRFIGALAQQKRRPAQNGKVEGANPSRATNFAHVVQCRDGALKTRTVSVQIRPWAPTACSPIRRDVPLKTERLQVLVLPRGPIWNVHRTSEPGLGANECMPSGKWCKSTAFRQFLKTMMKDGRLMMAKAGARHAILHSPSSILVCKSSCSPTSRGTTSRASKVQVRILP